MKAGNHFLCSCAENPDRGVPGTKKHFTEQLKHAEKEIIIYYLFMIWNRLVRYGRERAEEMDTKGIILWAGLLIIFAAGAIVSRRMKRQIEEEGIETVGVITRITDTGGPDEISLQYYAEYCTQGGEMVEGLLSNPTSDLTVGQRVRLRYHPKHRTNARLVR